MFSSGLRNQSYGKKIGINGSRIYHVTTLSFFQVFFLEKSLLLLMEQPPPRASAVERDLGYKCRLFLKSGLVSLSAIDGFAEAENNHRQFTADVDVDFHPAVPCVTV